MLILITIFSLIVLLFVCIKHIQYSLAVFLAIYILLPNLNFHGINVIHIALLEIVIGLVLCKKKKRKEVLKGMDLIFKLYAIVIIILSLFSFLFENYFSFSNYLVNMLGFILDYILIGMLFNHHPFQNKDINFFDQILLISIVIVVLYGFYNYIFQSNPYQTYVSLIENKQVDMSSDFLNEERGALHGRISSTFAHPLMLGQCLLLVTSYIIYRFNNDIVRWLSISILVVVVFLTGSRSAIIPIFITVLFYIISCKGSSIKKIIIPLLLFMVVFVFIPQTYKNTIMSMVSFWDKTKLEKNEINGSSTEMRQEQFHNTIRILGSDIIVGRGKGYVGKYGSKHSEMLGYESIIYTELFENGVLGLLGYFTFYMLLYIKLLKFAKHKRNKYRVHSLCVPFLICSIMTGHQYGIFTIYIIFYIMTLYSIRNEEESVCIKKDYDS